MYIYVFCLYLWTGQSLFVYTVLQYIQYIKRVLCVVVYSVLAGDRGPQPRTSAAGVCFCRPRGRRDQPDIQDIQRRTGKTSQHCTTNTYLDVLIHMENGKWKMINIQDMQSCTGNSYFTLCCKYLLRYTYTHGGWNKTYIQNIQRCTGNTTVCVCILSEVRLIIILRGV